MKIETEFPRKVIEHPDMGIDMPDGTRLSARVWMPEDAEDSPVPMILEHLPYRKRDGTIVRDQFSHPWMAGHGYCVIRTDMRGNGESEGLMEDEYTAQELQDACDVIAWAVQQPWCNGKVGMQGISWGGFNCLQVAALQPPGLEAVISICSTVDRYADDIHYKGGCLLIENFGWAVNMLSYSSRPPDPMLVGEDKWLEMWKHRLDHIPFSWSDWFRHQHRDDYWKHGSVCEDYSAIKAAVLSIGGWHDGYRNTISHLVENLSSPVKGIIGPWNHKYPHYAGPKPAIGFLQEAKRWWDKWLKGEETGVENDPAYRAYLVDGLPPKRWYDERPGRWVKEEEWPSPDIKMEKLSFQQDGSLGESPSAAGLTIKSPQDCGKASGEYFPFAFADELPADQSVDDRKSLTFDGAPLTDAIDIVGAPEISAKINSDKPSGFVAVRLCDVAPDGSSALIAHGFQNLTQHSSREKPEPLAPEQEVEITFKLDQCAYRVPVGHRLRVAISNAYWPFIWPSPETGELKIFNGSIGVPVRPVADGDEWTFEEPVGAKPWDATQLRASHYQRNTTVDEDTGIVTTTVDCDNGENRDDDHGLISGSWVKEAFHIHPDDPLSARATSEWEQTGGRPGQLWRTHVETEMTCDRDSFFTSAKLSVFVNDTLFFERTFDDSVDRQLI